MCERTKTLESDKFRLQMTELQKFTTENQVCKANSD